MSEIDPPYLETAGQIKEALLQIAIYCGVPAANWPSRSRRTCSPTATPYE